MFLPVDADVNFLSLVTSAVVLACVCWIWYFNRTPKPKPPGPPGWPIVGNLFEMPTDFAWLKYKEWSDQYNSDIIHLNALGTSIIVLNSLESMTDLFEGQKSLLYSDRPQSIMIHELMGWGDISFAIMKYGELWRSHRRTFHQEFQSQSVWRLHPNQTKATHNLLRRLLASPERWHEHVRHQSGAMIMDITYGIEVLPENDPYIKTAEDSLKSVMTASLPGAFLVDVFPFLKHVPAWVPGAGFQRQAMEWRRLSTDMVQVPYAAFKKDLADGSAKPSFVSRSLSAMDTNGDLDKQERIIKETASVVYGGGADTTVTAIMIFFLAMVKNPEIQAKAQAELDSVIGKGQLPTFGDKESLPYLMAIVKELLRWEVVAPLPLPRQLREDDVYKGYHLPKGSIVMVNAWAILHDEKVYPDPFTFNPERFLKDGKLDPSVQGLELAAFGTGRRICPGMHMALDTIWLTIGSVLAAFDIKKAVSPDGTVIEPSGKFLPIGILHHVENFICDIAPRSKEVVELLKTTAHAD